MDDGVGVLQEEERGGEGRGSRREISAAGQGSPGARSRSLGREEWVDRKEVERCEEGKKGRRSVEVSSGVE